MSKPESMEINGEHTTARVHLPESEVEDGLREEIQEQVNAPAFQNKIEYQPDCHGGLGPQAIVGFSMALGNRVVPNTIGGDIGCGMTAARLSMTVDDLEDESLGEIDEQVRSEIPMGTGVVHEDKPNPFLEVYPTTKADNRIFDLADTVGAAIPYHNWKFDDSFFTDLCQRVGTDPEYVLRSLGTLGSGNHFVELSASQETGYLWVIVHSGSRNLGQAVKSHWQDKATEQRENDVKWEQMDDVHREYALEDGSPDWEKIKADYDGEAIGELGEEIKSFQPDSHRNTKLDYLQGPPMIRYLRDMVFAQTYAECNRNQMVGAVAEVLGADICERINSPHNYVDFEDGMIRKGSTRAHQGEEFVIPMNMQFGSLICRGKGNPEYNYSAPHGSGRLGSRGWAEEEFDSTEVREAMADDGIFSSSVPTDEVPDAYKSVELIKQQIQPTAEIVDRLKPVINFKP